MTGTEGGGETITRGACRRGGTGKRRGRSMPLAAGMVIVLVAPIAPAAALPGATHMLWSGVLESRSLEDGSVLNEYVAWTNSPDERSVMLSIGFVPRFDCSPLISIRIAGAVAGPALADGDRLTLEIDGEPLELELLVDADGTATTFWIDATAESRERLRRRLDKGSRARLGLPGDRSIEFSLLGSSRSTAATEIACRLHEPLPYEDG